MPGVGFLGAVVASLLQVAVGKRGEISLTSHAMLEQAIRRYSVGGVGSTSDTSLIIDGVVLFILLSAEDTTTAAQFIHGMGQERSRQVVAQMRVSTRAAASEAARVEAMKPALESWTLTPREHEIMRELQWHRPLQSIASSMGVSINTMKTHVRTIYGKLGVSRRAQAIERARSLRLI